MELINWSLSAIDKVFSTKHRGNGDPPCPDGTFSAGYILDSWNEWRVVCLSILSVEDAEDMYIFGFMIAGFLLVMMLIALVAALSYRKISKSVACIVMPTLLAKYKESFREVTDRYDGLHREVSQIFELLKELSARSAEAHKRLEYMTAQTVGLSNKNDELCRMVTALKARMDAGAYRNDDF